MVKDPVCGMNVDKEKTIKRRIGDRTYYFCSETCARTYEQPEQELKPMKHRVALALAGIISVTALRAIIMFGLSAAIMTSRVVGISAWDLAFFISSTPIVWITG